MSFHAAAARGAYSLRFPLATASALPYATDMRPLRYPERVFVAMTSEMYAALRDDAVADELVPDVMRRVLEEWMARMAAKKERR